MNELLITTDPRKNKLYERYLKRSGIRVKTIFTELQLIEVLEIENPEWIIFEGSDLPWHSLNLMQTVKQKFPSMKTGYLSFSWTEIPITMYLNVPSDFILFQAGANRSFCRRLLLRLEAVRDRMPVKAEADNFHTVARHILLNGILELNTCIVSIGKESWVRPTQNQSIPDIQRRKMELINKLHLISSC